MAKTSKVTRLPIVLLAGALLSCGSMQVDRVPAGESEVEGVRVQMPALEEITVVLLDPAGKRIVFTEKVVLPDTEQHQELNFKGGQLTSRELSVSLHPGGTLKEYSFVKKEKGVKGVEALTSATREISEALLAIEAAEAPAPAPDPLEVENQQLLLQLLKAMLDANLKALEEGRSLPYPEVFQAAGSG